jgi:hypothetical protein
MDRDEARGPRLAAVLGAVALAAATACGGLRNHMHKIPVTSAPPGASITVDGRPMGRTPALIWLTRKAKVHVIRVEYPGYAPSEIRTSREPSGTAFLGDLLAGFVCSLPLTAYQSLSDHHTTFGLNALGFIGLFVLLDVAQGGFYDVWPKELTVTLVKDGGQEGVRTIEVSPGALRELVWIRVKLAQPGDR